MINDPDVSESFPIFQQYILHIDGFTDSQLIRMNEATRFEIATVVIYLCNTPWPVRARRCTGKVDNTRKIWIFWILKMRNGQVWSRIGIWGWISIWVCFGTNQQKRQKMDGKYCLSGKELTWFARFRDQWKYIWDDHKIYTILHLTKQFLWSSVQVLMYYLQTCG